MTSPASHIVTFALAIALAPAPLPGHAIAPALLLFIKHMVQQTATSMIKDTLLSGLSGMGCKGMALANALESLDRGAEGGGFKLPMGGLPIGGLPMGGLPKVPAGMLTGGAGLPPEVMAQMKAMMPGVGQLPAGMAVDPEQQAAMLQMQQAMSQPLSVPETLATIDELFELGFLPGPVQIEFKQCLLLVPATIPALGMGMGMLKPMVPQLRQARDELRALSPAEQDEVASAIAQEVRALPSDQRQALIEHLDSGFFPARVSRGVKSRLAGR